MRVRIWLAMLVVNIRDVLEGCSNVFRVDFLQLTFSPDIPQCLDKCGVIFHTCQLT